MEHLFGILFAVNFIINYAQYNDKDRYCLTEAIYYEAGSEKTQDALEAVGHVIINRTESKGFPNSICSTVYQKHAFSYTGVVKQKKNDQIWRKAQRVAFLVSIRDFMWKYYPSKLKLTKNKIHNVYWFLNPKLTNATTIKQWLAKTKIAFQIENHIFFKK